MRHLVTGVGSSSSLGRSRFAERRLRGDRQADDELAPLARPVAAGLDAPAVQLDQPLDQRQADAEPALRPHQRRFRLREHLEDARQHLGGDADAVVLDRHDHVAPLPLGTQPDAAAFLGVLGGVVEQVGEHLGQPHRVGLEVDRLRRQGDGELVAAGLDDRTAGFQGGLHHGGQLDPLLAEFQLVAGDARHVEQVFEQPGHELHLAVDHVPGPLQLRVGRALGLEDLHGVADRGQRVAQLVGQRGQELVLLAVGVLQGRLDLACAR